MKTFIQLRDGIGYAVVKTTSEPDHSATPDHSTIVEVFTDNPDQFLCKAYNADTGTWVDAPILRYAEINGFGEIIEICKTVFAHSIPSGAVELPLEANVQWKFIDNAWQAPVVIVPVESEIAVESNVVVESP
jgi:hypothetical protein